MKRPQGKHFKVKSDATIARSDANNLKKNLNIQKLRRGEDGNSIRIKTEVNYSKWRVETETRILPGDQKVVTLLGKDDQICSQGYQTDQESEEVNQQQQNDWLDRSILAISQKGERPIEIYNKLQSDQQRIYATKCWNILKSAEEIYEENSRLLREQQLFSQTQLDVPQQEEMKGQKTKKIIKKRISKRQKAHFKEHVARNLEKKVTPYKNKEE